MPDLTLLTATEAARILDVDLKTFRRMQVPYVPVVKSKRYTLTILRDWVEQSTVHPAPLQSETLPKRAPLKRYGSNAGAGRRVGKAASAPGGIAVEQAAGLKRKVAPASAAEILEFERALGIKGRGRRQVGRTGTRPSSGDRPEAPEKVGQPKHGTCG